MIDGGGSEGGKARGETDMMSALKGRGGQHTQKQTHLALSKGEGSKLTKNLADII